MSFWEQRMHSRGYSLGLSAAVKIVAKAITDLKIDLEDEATIKRQEAVATALGAVLARLEGEIAARQR